MALRHYSNMVQPTSLTSGLTDSAGTANVASTANYPAVPFTIGIDRGTPDEEVCLATAKTPTTLTISRGYDGTTAVAHDNGAAVEHCTVALDYAEANAHVEDDTRDDHSQYLNATRIVDYLPKWYAGSSLSAISPISTTYAEILTMTIPSATFSRKVVFWGQTSFVALTTEIAVYRLAIRTSGTSVSHLPWYCTDAGISGNINLVSSPIILASGSAYTYGLYVRRDSGSGGQTDGDSDISKFTALVTANL